MNGKWQQGLAGTRVLVRTKSALVRIESLQSHRMKRSVSLGLPSLPNNELPGPTLLARVILLVPGRGGVRTICCTRVF